MAQIKENGQDIYVWEEWEILADDASYSLPLWLISGAKTGENAKDKREDEVKCEQGPWGCENENCL